MSMNDPVMQAVKIAVLERAVLDLMAGFFLIGPDPIGTVAAYIEQQQRVEDGSDEAMLVETVRQEFLDRLMARVVAKAK